LGFFAMCSVMLSISAFFFLRLIAPCNTSSASNLIFVINSSNVSLLRLSRLVSKSRSIWGLDKSGFTSIFIVKLFFEGRFNQLLNGSNFGAHTWAFLCADEPFVPNNSNFEFDESK